MKKKKVNIDSTEPIKSIAEVDMVVDAFVKRGGYITIEEDLKIRKRILNRNHLASWISYVKNKLIYKKKKIVKHLSVARTSIKKKGASMISSSPISKPVKEEHNVNVVLKQSLNIDSYSDICKEDPNLRPYQQKAKKEIFESWDEVDNVMFQMPTGTGKTRLFTSIIRDINDYSIQRREPVKILIIAHRTELIEQIGENLDKYHVGHNFMAGGMERKHKYPVYVASIQTITNAHNIKDAKKLKVQFIIIDEAHHALAASYKKLWEMYPDAKRLGVTATPWRMNHQSFTSLFNKLVLSMPIKDFIKQGYLAPYKYFSLKNDTSIQRTIDGIELDSFGEYKESSMEEKMDIGSIRAQLLDSYLSLADGKKGIIYAINRIHAKHICNEYENAGYRAVCIDSKTPDTERKDLVKKFRKGQIDIIVNVDIFSEGFDCPDIEFIQLARPTRSLVKYLQQVGRGLRLTENKQHCIILDNVGMYSRFGLPDARRHWKYHFIGQDVDEEPNRISQGAGAGGGQRYVDLSEGTEDMELIQDDYEEFETAIAPTASNNELFPLFGVTLGETTCEEARELGGEDKVDEDTGEIYCDIENVQFFYDNFNILTSIYYWTKNDRDFPNLWKSKGLSWENSYDEWLDVFKCLGYKIEKEDEPEPKMFDGRITLSGRFEALSPDGTLTFCLSFDYGEKGYYTSSPSTLYSISVHYHESKNDIDDDYDEEDIVDEEIIPQAENIKTIDDSDIEHVYVDIPSADPYTELEYEDVSTDEEIKKPKVPIDPRKLDKIFEKKASSYKYFWFMAIISLAKEKNNFTISYKDIVIRMAAMAWPIIFEYEIDLGKGDMIPKYLNDILKQSPLTKNIPSKVVEAYLKVYYESEGIGKILEPLLKNVPYRFLSPWITYTNDEEVIEKSNSGEYACLYALRDDSLILNSDWWNYLKKRYFNICNSAERSFITYAKQKNKHNKFTYFMATGWSLV